jgi:hypothetical protein
LSSRISVITSGFGPDKWGSIPWGTSKIFKYEYVNYLLRNLRSVLFLSVK